MKKFCIIIPWIGKFPKNNLFKIILNQLSKQKYVNFIFAFFDLENARDIKFEEYANIEAIYVGKDFYSDYCTTNFKLDICSELLEKHDNEAKFGRDFFCGMKPFIPHMFNCYFYEYEYVGWMDYDCLLSNNFFEKIVNNCSENPDIIGINKNAKNGQLRLFKQEAIETLNGDLKENALKYYQIHNRMRHFDEKFPSELNDNKLSWYYIFGRNSKKYKYLDITKICKCILHIDKDRNTSFTNIKIINNMVDDEDFEFLVRLDILCKHSSEIKDLKIQITESNRFYYDE